MLLRKNLLQTLLLLVVSILFLSSLSLMMSSTATCGGKGDACSSSSTSSSTNPCCSGYTCNPSFGKCMPPVEASSPSSSSTCSSAKTIVGKKACNYASLVNGKKVIDDAGITKATGDWTTGNYPYVTDSEITALTQMWTMGCDLTVVCGGSPPSKTTTTTYGYATTTTTYGYATTTTPSWATTTTTTIAQNTCYDSFLRTNNKACDYDTNNNGYVEDKDINKAMGDKNSGKLTDGEYFGIVDLWVKACYIRDYCSSIPTTTTTTIPTNPKCMASFGYNKLFKECPKTEKFKEDTIFATANYLSNQKSDFTIDEVNDLITFYLSKDIDNEDCSKLGRYTKKQMIASSLGKAQVTSGSLKADFSCDKYELKVGEKTNCHAKNPDNFCLWYTSGGGFIKGSSNKGSIEIKASYKKDIKVGLYVCSNGAYGNKKEKTIKVLEGDGGGGESEQANFDLKEIEVLPKTGDKSTGIFYISVTIEMEEYASRPDSIIVKLFKPNGNELREIILTKSSPILCSSNKKGKTCSVIYEYYWSPNAADPYGFYSVRVTGYNKNSERKTINSGLSTTFERRGTELGCDWIGGTWSSGPAINLVFIGHNDALTDDEFSSGVKDVIKYLKTKKPFTEEPISSFLNFYQVHSVRDLNCFSQNGMMACDDVKINSIIQSECPSFPNRNGNSRRITIVLANIGGTTPDTPYAGAPIAYCPPNDPGTCIHEFGHTLGLLDEYVKSGQYSRTPRKISEKYFSNCAKHIGSNTDLQCKYWCKETKNKQDLENIGCSTTDFQSCDINGGVCGWTPTLTCVNAVSICSKRTTKDDCEKDNLCVLNEDDKIHPYFESNCIPEYYKKINIGKNCEAGTGCYFGCNYATDWYRSSLGSIMKNYDPAKFNKVQQEIIKERLIDYAA